jgi:hypothetical protein
MVHPGKSSGSQKPRRWVKYVGYSLLSLVVLVAALYVYVFVWFVPPISVKVVDAISGKPVQGINLCLQAQSRFFQPQVLRKEMSTTGTWGRSFFWPSLHQMGVLGEWDGYSIRITDPQTDLAVPCGPDLGPGLNEVSEESGDLQPVQNARRIYFPVVVVHGGKSKESNSGWSTTRHAMGFPLNQRIALIPILQSSEDCRQVRDPLQEQDCRALNAEATATTPLYMFPTSVAGMPRIHLTSFTTAGFPGEHRYEAIYAQDGNSHAYIRVQIEEFPLPEHAKDRIEELRREFAVGKTVPASEEGVSPDQKADWYRTPAQAEAFWASGQQVIRVRFDMLLDREKEEGFVASCLRLYPVTW